MKGKNEEIDATEKKEQYWFFSIGLGVVLLGLAVLNSFSLITSAGILDEMNSVSLAAAPAKIELITINQAGCNQCASLSEIGSFIKSQNVDAKQRTLDTTDAEAKQLIEKYGIEKLPSMIVLGDWKKAGLENAWQQYGTVDGNALVFRNNVPPFFSLSEKKINGVLSITTITDSKCNNCANIKAIASQISSIAYVGEEKSFDYSSFDSNEAKILVEKFNLLRVPAIIISSDLVYYPEIAGAWKTIGSIEPTGEFVSREFPLPYREISTGYVKGLVGLTMLKDSNCSSCFEITEFKDILTRTFGMEFNKEEIFDINSSEGKKVLFDYNVTVLPTIIVSSDANQYSGFSLAWESVGTMEKDNSFVLRNLAALKVGYETLDQNTGKWNPSS